MNQITYEAFLSGSDEALIEGRKSRISGQAAVLVICLFLLLIISGCSLVSDDNEQSDSEIIDSSTSFSDSNSVSDSLGSDSQTAGSEPTDNQSVDDTTDETKDEGIQWYPDNSWVYIDNSWLNIRNGPSTDNAVITEVYQAQALKRVAVSDYWSEIVLPDGRTGYAYNSYLSLMPVEEIEP